MSTSAPAPPSVPPPASAWRRRRQATAIGSALVLLAALIAAAFLMRDSSGDATSSPTAVTTPAAVAPAPSTTVPPAAFRFVPLWPFGSVDEAAAWQKGSGAAGPQAWRLDAAATAVTFASSYLGYSEIDRVASSRITGDEAWIGVGGAPTEGRQGTCAVLHLARIGTGPLSGRPWEVVGSEDTTLTLTVPPYGSTVGTRLTVGGMITGVDEALAVQVRSLRGGLLGSVSGVPAGGQQQPWRVGLTLTPATGPATVAVAAGGHLRAVERFAITAVRVLPGTPAATGFATADAALASTVAHGRYVGACDTAPATGPAGTRVCSVLLHRAGDRYLYRVGYQQTDSGYFVILRYTSAGRWIVLDGDVPGADVPADLGGPIPST